MGAPKTVYQKAIAGGQFTFAGKVIQEMLVAARLIVLARLLVPRDFGLMGIVMLAISVVNLFTQPGLMEAFVQKAKYDNKDLSAIWTFGLFRGIVLTAIIFLLSPFIASFFDNQGKFESNHLLNPKNLVVRLKESSDPRVQEVVAHLSPETQQAIASYSPETGVSEDLQKGLVCDLNAMIQIPGFYRASAFNEITTREEFLKTMNYFPDNDQKINRLLLEEIFGDIRKVIFAPQSVTMAMRFLSLSFLFGALGNPGMIFFKRSLKFKQVALWNTGTTFLTIVSTVIFAVLLRSFWALVWGRLISQVITVFVTYRVHAFRPSLTFDFHRLKPYWGFGKHILSSSILRFIILEGDDIFVAKMLGPVTLGFYRYAYKFASMVATEIGDVISQVTFPTLSRIQDDIPKLRSGYIKTLQCLSLVVFPASGGLFVLAEYFVSVILGDQWLSIVPTMRVLCVLGVSRCSQSGIVLRSLGRPDVDFKVLRIRLILIVISIYPLTMKFGLPGTAMSVAYSTLVILPIQFFYVNKLISFSFFDYLKIISLPTFSTLGMMVSLYYIKSFMTTQNIIIFIFLILCGFIVYLFSILILRNFYKDYNIFSLVKELLLGQR